MRWFVTELKTYIKERRKRRQWMRPWIRKRDSKKAYYSIINCLRLTDKEDIRKKIWKKTLAAVPILLFCLNKNQKYVSPLFSILCKWTLFIKVFFTTHVSFCFTSCNSENKRTYSAQVRLNCVLLKKWFLYNE